MNDVHQKGFISPASCNSGESFHLNLNQIKINTSVFHLFEIKIQ